ncbi:MAG: VWA domain-containing protein [Acidobacteria bacterium]|nr:VWA domain-containing protein [Acidobacteriota bacterium]
MAAVARVSVAVLGVVLGRAALPGASAAQVPVFRTSVEMVRVDVSVTRGGVPVDGLLPGHFQVLDNGVAQTIERVSREEVPLRLLLALDTSGSVAGERLRALVDAAQTLVRALRPDDQVGLLTFDQAIRLAIAPTRAHAEVIGALDRLEASGPTAWRDALFAGLQLVGDPADARPVVLLFTDGDDTASWVTPRAIGEVVRRSGVVLHAVGLAAPRKDTADGRRRWLDRQGPAPSLLQAVEAGGGHVWSAESAAALRRLFTGALDELRARYLVVYARQGTTAPGWHQVSVRLKGVRGDVRARPGYFVPAR